MNANEKVNAGRKAVSKQLFEKDIPENTVKAKEYSAVKLTCVNGNARRWLQRLYSKHKKRRWKSLAFILAD